MQTECWLAGIAGIERDDAEDGRPARLARRIELLPLINLAVAIGVGLDALEGTAGALIGPARRRPPRAPPDTSNRTGRRSSASRSDYRRRVFDGQPLRRFPLRDLTARDAR